MPVVDPSLVHINAGLAVFMRETGGGDACQYSLCLLYSPWEMFYLLHSVPRCTAVLYFCFFFSNQLFYSCLFYNALHNQKKLRVGTLHTSHTETTHLLAA